MIILKMNSFIEAKLYINFRETDINVGLSEHRVNTNSYIYIYRTDRYCNVLK